MSIKIRGIKDKKIKEKKKQKRVLELKGNTIVSKIYNEDFSFNKINTDNIS
ncbi:hypothetical protein PIROE2DRAFT_5424 [Piromyces sp. E2]|nr:hypothetical protein PIROE2DRAFT_5424 [Piromyces sp. E2]|eukprot:OUM67159.1 hypothetical protein PIROE2DRAFT_5424 [Piromyces sp. E2]